MNFIRRWIVVGILIVFAVLSFSKGLNLWSLRSNVDGNGIGIHFLVFEISDSVSSESILNYSIGFFTLSSIALIISIVFIRKNLLQHTQ